MQVWSARFLMLLLWLSSKAECSFPAISRNEHEGVDRRLQVDTYRDVFRQKLTPADSEIGDYHGFSVAVHGRFAAAGVPREDDSGSDAGIYKSRQCMDYIIICSTFCR